MINTAVTSSKLISHVLRVSSKKWSSTKNISSLLRLLGENILGKKTSLGIGVGVVINIGHIFGRYVRIRPTEGVTKMIIIIN